MSLSLKLISLARRQWREVHDPYTVRAIQHLKQHIVARGITQADVDARVAELEKLHDTIGDETAAETDEFERWVAHDQMVAIQEDIRGLLGERGLLVQLRLSVRCKPREVVHG